MSLNPSAQDMFSFSDSGFQSLSMLSEVSETMKGETLDAMDAEVDPVTGSKWVGLSELTKRSKSGGKILEESGGLKEDIRKRTPVLRTAVGSMSVEIGTGKKYAPIHQKGKKIRGTQFIPRTSEARRRSRSESPSDIGLSNFIFAQKTTIPRRRFMGIGSSMIDSIREVITRNLIRRML